MGRDYARLRRARLPLVQELYALGVPYRTIAVLTGVCLATVRNDLSNVRENGEYQDRPRKAAPIFQAALKRYAALFMAAENGKSRGKKTAPEAKLLAALKQWLKEDEIIAFMRGLGMSLRLLLQPTYPHRYQGYVKLLYAVFDLNVEERPQRVASDDCQCRVQWRYFLHRIMCGEQPAPASRDELYQTLADWWVSDNRNHIFPVWNDVALRTMRSIIDDQIGSLMERQAVVVRMRFGLDPDRPRMTLEAIGCHFGVSRECIRHNEAAALQHLRRRLGALEILAMPVADVLTKCLSGKIGRDNAPPLTLEQPSQKPPEELFCPWQ